MKVVKGFVSVILGFIMLVALTLFTLITGIRIMFSGDNLGSIAKELAKENAEFRIGEIIDDSNISSEEFDEAMDTIEKYISKDEIYEVFGDLANQIIRYTLGASDDIDADGVKATIAKIAKEVEKETGEKIDLDEINESLDRAIAEAKQSIKEDTREDREAIEILGNVYNDGLYYGLIGGFVVCAILLVVMYKSPVALAIHLIIINVLDGILNLVIGYLPKTITSSDSVDPVIFDKLGGIFTKMGLIELLVIVVAIIVLVVHKKTKKQVVVTT